MPMNFDGATRTDTIVHGVTALIRDGGMPAVTMRAIAAATGISLASLAAHLGSRQHLLQVVAARFGDYRVDDMEQRSCTDGLLALLPACAEDVADLRVWLSWCDLGRTNEGVGRSVTGVEAREWWLVVGALARECLSASDPVRAPGVSGVQRIARLDDPTRVAVLAAAHDVMSIVLGVRHLLCQPQGPLSTDDARRVADRLLAAAAATWPAPLRARLSGTSAA